MNPSTIVAGPGPTRELQAEAIVEPGADYILFDLGRYGNDSASQLQQHGARVLGVDFDPELVAAREHRGYAVQYGDADDPDLPSSHPLRHARWVVCTIPWHQTNDSRDPAPESLEPGPRRGVGLTDGRS
jgi:hypothetical protein